MNAPDPQLVIETAEITGVIGCEPVSGGMSGAILWRVRRQPPETDLLLRLFPSTSLSKVEQEAIHQHRAASGGIPVPEITFVGQVQSCPVIVMAWVDGRTMIEQLVETPDRTEHLGHTSGATLARIHALPVPESSPTEGTVAHWLSCLDPWLRDRVSVEPARRTLVHADYHPVNILTDGEDIRSVLDWTNASVAHPLIDLGRSFACLRLGASLFADLLAADTVDTWWRGLVSGYGASSLSIEDLAPYFAVGLVTLVEERTRIASPDIPSSIIESLIVERDLWLDLAFRTQVTTERRHPR